MTTYYKWLGNGFLMGVTPTRDLTEKEWDVLTDDQQSALKPYYVKTEPKAKQDAPKRSAKKPTIQESD